MRAPGFFAYREHSRDSSPGDGASSRSAGRDLRRASASQQLLGLGSWLLRRGGGGGEREKGTGRGGAWRGGGRGGERGNEPLELGAGKRGWTGRRLASIRIWGESSGRVQTTSPASRLPPGKCVHDGSARCGFLHGGELADGPNSADSATTIAYSCASPCSGEFEELFRKGGKRHLGSDITIGSPSTPLFTTTSVYTLHSLHRALSRRPHRSFSRSTGAHSLRQSSPRP